MGKMVMLLSMFVEIVSSQMVNTCHFLLTIKANMLEQLQVVIIDEISMIGANALTQIHHKGTKK